MTPPHYATVSALHDAFRSGRAQPSDAVLRWLARDPRERGRPVWISTASEDALRARARLLDRALADDPERALAKPLFGALVAVKDNIDVAGLPTTAACPAFAYEPTQSASVVAALETAGALVVGKTNLDQFATGLVGTRSPYGAVSNPFDARFISGGSSSGSAVAVAEGLVHVALGTDTAGSGRVPAGFNNIVGWKPTRGLLPTDGVVPACRSLDCVSIFALTVADAARAFCATAERGPRTPRLDRARLHEAFAFALPRRDELEFFGDARAARAFDAAIERLRVLGGVPAEIDYAPLRAIAAMLYEGPHVAERHAGIRVFFDAHPDELDPIVRSIVAGARNFSATDLFEAQAALEQRRRALGSLFDGCDVLVVPTAPTIYPIADVQAEPIELNRRLGLYTNFVNLLDLAAIAVPAALRDDGLPFGITLIGPAGSDLMLADLAQRFHADTGLPLGALDAPPPSVERLLPRADTIEVAVVGAHLAGLPLNHELVQRGARLVRPARTAPSYRLYALPGTVPPKPGLVRVADGDGAAIGVEVWEMPTVSFGSFVAAVPAPLSIGTIALEDGSFAHGFLCEGVAATDADDITHYGGWRAYLAARANGAAGRPRASL